MTRKSFWTPTSGSGTDDDAIHDNVAGEIAAITEKATPVSADLLLIEDSEASNAKKRVQVGNLPGGGGGTSLTTKGDLHGYDTDDARVPVGTDGHVLTADSAQALGLKWAAIAASGANSGAKVSDPSGTNQNVEVTTDTPVTFDTEDFDDDGYANLGTNNDRLTFTSAGLYIVGGTISYQGGAGVARWADARINLNGTLYDIVRIFTNNTASRFIQVVTVVDAAVNDYVQLVAHNEGGGDITHNSFAPHLWLVKL